MRKKIGIISLLTLISIMAIIPKSYGALTSKPTTKTDGSNVLVNKKISDSYILCQQMTLNGESLYGSSVKPHLATNKDWGAVSYLSNSAYGTNTAGKNTGVSKTINGVDYYSTTGNASGVMNWGDNPYKDLYTRTSGIIQAYMDLENKTNTNITELVNAATNNSPYVEIIKTKSGGFNESTDGMAFDEIISNNYSFVSMKRVAAETGYPISSRKGLFGFAIGNPYGGTHAFYNGHGATGESLSWATFRPVVWN